MNPDVRTVEQTGVSIIPAHSDVVPTACVCIVVTIMFEDVRKCALFMNSIILKRVPGCV